MNAKNPEMSGEKKTNGNGAEPVWELRLYTAGQTPKSLAALANLKRLC